jgi:hypothetical protein
MKRDIHLTLSHRLCWKQIRRPASHATAIWRGTKHMHGMSWTRPCRSTTSCRAAWVRAPACVILSQDAIGGSQLGRTLWWPASNLPAAAMARQCSWMTRLCLLLQGRTSCSACSGGMACGCCARRRTRCCCETTSTMQYGPLPALVRVGCRLDITTASAPVHVLASTNKTSFVPCDCEGDAACSRTSLLQLAA